jgi:hypothetical protein
MEDAKSLKKIIPVQYTFRAISAPGAGRPIVTFFWEENGKTNGEPIKVELTRDAPKDEIVGLAWQNFVQNPNRDSEAEYRFGYEIPESPIGPITWDKPESSDQDDH